MTMGWMPACLSLIIALPLTSNKQCLPWVHRAEQLTSQTAQKKIKSHMTLHTNRTLRFIIQTAIKQKTHNSPDKKQSTHNSPHKEKKTHNSPHKEQKTHNSPHKEQKTHNSPHKKQTQAATDHLGHLLDSFQRGSIEVSIVLSRLHKEACLHVVLHLHAVGDKVVVSALHLVLLGLPCGVCRGE